MKSYILGTQKTFKPKQSQVSKDNGYNNDSNQIKGYEQDQSYAVYYVKKTAPKAEPEKPKETKTHENVNSNSAQNEPKRLEKEKPRQNHESSNKNNYSRSKDVEVVYYVKKNETKDQSQIIEGEEQKGDQKKNNVRKQRNNRQEPKDKPQNKEIEATSSEGQPEANAKKEDEKTVAAPILESVVQQDNSKAEESIDRPSDSNQEVEQKTEEVSSPNGKHTLNHLN